MNPASILMAYGYITKKSLIAFLYLRCTGRSGAGNFYGNLPVDPKQASAGETGESKKKIRAAAAARK